ncbi:hypothetical protein HK097_010010 [Rhizophlyctis rosea]|uniref:C3H1-type domain-containing protein n=1 Tax=Rhizophlyctis rosea TaxID=64517 RepID=A0AAD5SI85_9FUNG|nr:hypothetical protein HK097_010010 [Rhizophlyctis rosea]
MPSVRHQTESCPDVYEMAKLACKYFTNTGHCSAGNACRFKHYTGDGLKAVRVCWIQQRQENRRTQHISSDPTDPHHKSSATLRAAIFVQWLVETYGTSYLSSGTGVLDIGGGRGIISFELSCKSSIPSTLIDPRNDHDREEGVRPNKAQRQWLKQQSKNGVKPDNLLQPSHIRTTFDSEFITRNKDLVERSSIFIGMHADQATEPIVDQALACGKPFAVLPCCVFPRENPGRRLKDGREVLTYEEFVQFLEEKDERIKKAFLPFEGRNLVLYAEATEKI